MFGKGKNKNVSVNTDPAKVEEVLTRGVSEVINIDDLRKKMLSGQRLRIKLGIDPTSPNLHLGRSVPLLKMRDFQDLGHQALLLVGDFTGVIGDTSDKDSERPMIDDATIELNKKNYFKQMGKIIDLDQAETFQNSKWLSKLGYKEIGEQADMFSINQFIQRENIRKRLDEGKRVSLREVLYPLMQGYDSIPMKADVELGGTDQRFNLLAGRTLQEKYGMEPQNIVMGPLVNGLDGRKMSSSWGNTINFSDEPNDMFGKIMSVTDDLILEYFTVFTRVPMDKIKEYEKSLSDGANPRDIKIALAKEIVKMYHDEKSAESAEKNFIQAFSKGGAPEDIQIVKVKSGELLIDVLVREKVVESKSEFRRLIEGGGITNLDSGEKVSDIAYVLNKPQTVKVGKRRFLKVEVE